MAVTPSLVKELRERTGLGMMECKKALKETDGDIEVAIENLRKASGLKAAKKADRQAAEGVVFTRLSDDNKAATVIEVNSETDFVARDENFLKFVGNALDIAFEAKLNDVSTLAEGPVEESRQALVQKIGENIGVRRVASISVDEGIIGAYTHSNNKIAVLTVLSGGDAELAKDVAMHIAAVNPQVVNPDDMPEDVVNKEKEIIKSQPDMEGKPDEIVDKMMVGRIKKFLKENSLVEQAFVKNPDVTIGELVKQSSASVLSFVRFEVGEGIEKKQEDFAAEVAAQLAANKS